MLSTSNTPSKKPYHSLLMGASIGLMVLTFSQTAAAITTKNIIYTVDDQAYEGYYAKADKAHVTFYLTHS